MNSDNSDLDDPQLSQLSLFAVQIGLYRVWTQEYGATPLAVVGHSLGEVRTTNLNSSYIFINIGVLFQISAYWAANVLTTDEAVALTNHRSHLQANTSTPKQEGKMLTAKTSPEEANKAIDKVGGVGRAAIACINAHNMITISGDGDVIGIHLALF